MKKSLGTIIIALFFTVFIVGGPCVQSASAVIFEFDPNDLINLYPATAGDQNDPSTYKAVQPNARRIHQSWASTYYDTFYNPANPHTQPNDYNTYMNWRESLGPNEGIAQFNIWLLDNPAARSWGEKVVWNPGGPAPTATADDGGLWKVQVINNPWGSGYLAEWWTDNSNYYLRPGGADIGKFGFSGIAYWDNNNNGYEPSDPLVQVGEYARIWFGSYYADSQNYSVYFDDSGFGNRSPSGNSFAAGNYSGWEGVLEVPTPEPTTMLLLGSGLIGLAGYGRKKFFKK